MKQYILQGTLSNEQTSQYALMIFIWLIAAVVILLIARAIFQVAAIVRYQKIQCRLLSRIAKQGGSTQEEIDKIFNS